MQISRNLFNIITDSNICSISSSSSPTKVISIITRVNSSTRSPLSPMKDLEQKRAIELRKRQIRPKKLEYRKIEGQENQSPQKPLKEINASAKPPLKRKRDLKLNDSHLVQFKEMNDRKREKKNDFLPKDPILLDFDEKIEDKPHSEDERRSSPINSLSRVEQEQFFQTREPAEWFPVVVDRKNKVKFKIPKELGKKGIRLIYEIRFNNSENCRHLIGKTSHLLGRFTQYANKINDPHTSQLVKAPGKIQFYDDFQTFPSDFEVGIMYYLHPDDDIDEVEDLFIKSKKGIGWILYNDLSGGGGGLGHIEEGPLTYVVPSNVTPKKYYPCEKDEKGRIRFQFSPGFKDHLADISRRLGDTTTFAYSIKHMPTQKRYIGVTCNAEDRAYRHGCNSEYAVPGTKKYDPDRLSGRIHHEIAKDPSQFGFGVFPLESSKMKEKAEDETESQDQEIEYFHLEGRDKLERFLILIKKSLYTQHGFNMNAGGGGPFPRSVKKQG